MILFVPGTDDVSFDLTEDERAVLRAGLLEWGGPARCTEELAVGMGFASVGDLFAEGDRLRAALANYEPMSRLDWARTLLATEIVFASDLVGSGWDWSITTGFSDDHTLAVLRGLQRKLIGSLRPIVGNGLGSPRAS
jgi:hypothetical protein